MTGDIFEELQQRQDEADQLVDDVEDLDDDVDAYLTSVGNDIHTYVNKKKMIVTTNTGTAAAPAPSFTGYYAGLTNADFAAGSICYILYNN